MRARVRFDRSIPQAMHASIHAFTDTGARTHVLRVQIRTGMLRDHKPVELEKGSRLTLTTDYAFEGDATKIACSYAHLPRDVKVGDIILAVQTRGRAATKVNGPEQLRDELAKAPLRGRAELTVERGGWTKDVTVTLAAPEVRIFIGIRLSTDDGRLTISEVVKDSPASKIGLRPGDVLVAAEGRALNTPRDLALVLTGKKPGDVVKLVVERDGWKKSLKLTLGRR